MSALGSVISHPVVFVAGLSLLLSGTWLLRKGGLIGIDNVLWSGNVIDPTNTTPDTKAIRALNEKIAADPRVSISLVPIGDGLTLARKR